MVIDLNKEFNNLLLKIDTTNKPNLFLHVCCGPCSSAVLDRLGNYFNIYLIFYNPNIDTCDEYNKRFNELKKLINGMNLNFPIIYQDYNHSEFLDFVKGYEKYKEGEARCSRCFLLRLDNSLKIAQNYIKSKNLTKCVNYFCTTLSVSPHKDAKLLYEIGNELVNNYLGFIYLPSDFKKEDGYLNSIKLSKLYNLYRQDYCGCEFSKNA